MSNPRIVPAKTPTDQLEELLHALGVPAPAPAAQAVWDLLDRAGALRNPREITPPDRPAPDTASPGCVSPDCRIYYCPTGGETECPTHSGFDVCCDRPDLHQPLLHVAEPS